MTQLPRTAILSLVLAMVAACATKQQTGAVAGAGAGGAVGGALAEGHPAGVLLGALFGAAVGSELGRSMDEYDRQRAAVILEDYPTDRTAVWENPDTGDAYRMTPERTYYRAEGLPCREFRMEAQVGYDWEEVYGTACRQPDGSWQIVET